MTDDFDAGAQKKGRPEFVPCPATLEAARSAAAAGKADEAIADEIGVSVPTLRKHCAEALASGRAEIQPTLFVQPDVSAQPTPEKAKRGRKRYVPFSNDRARVRQMAAAGIPHKVIAAKLAISEPTLRRAFADDLAEAEASAKADIIESLHRQMVAGSTAAAKALKDMIDEATLADAARRLGVPAPKKEAERETQGKKASATRNAEKLVKDGKWAQLLQ